MKLSLFTALSGQIQGAIDNGTINEGALIVSKNNASDTTGTLTFIDENKKQIVIGGGAGSIALLYDVVSED